MALRVVIGPANAGKTGAVYSRLREQAAHGGPSALLLPSEPDVVRAVREFAAETPLGMSIVTFGRYLADLWARFGDGRRLVTPVQRAALVADVLSGSTWAPHVPPSRGLETIVRGLVQRAADGERPLRASASTEGVAGTLLDAVIRYEAALRNAGLVEPATAYRLAVTHMDSTELPPVIGVNRFTGLTRAQEDFVVAAARVAEVIVSLTYDPGVPATVAAAELVGRLAAAGAVETLTSPGGASAELTAIEQGLGVAGREAVTPAGSVVLSEAWGGAAEADRIAAEVQRAVADGISPARIAVAFRDVSRHLTTLRTAFASAGIDAEYDAVVPLRTTGLGRAVIALLGYAADPSPGLGGLMDVLRTPYSPAADGVLDEVDARYRGRRGASAVTIERELGRLDHATGTFLAQARACCRREGALDLAGWQRLTTSMLARAHTPGEMLGVEALLDCSAQRVFLEALTQLTEAGVAAPGPARLADLLRDEGITLVPADSGDRVQVMPVGRLRGRRFECVILGGLTRDEFPQRRRDDALSSPRVAGVLAAAGIDPADRSGVPEERLMFYQAATRAARRLVLSWQSHDDAGADRARSVFVEEVLDLYRHGSDAEGDPPLVRRVIGPDPHGPGNDTPATRRRRAQDAALTGGRTGDVGLDDVLAVARYRATAPERRLSPEVRHALAGREVFSASEIETYLGCPYRWFVSSVLRPRALDAEVDASVEGSVAHLVMQRFYDRFTAVPGRDRVTPGNLAEALELHSEVVEAVVGETPTLTLAEDAAVLAAARDTARLVRADAVLLPGMVPRYREWEFGRDQDDLGEDLGGFRLAGRVDRIDTDGTSLVITDYKRGRIGPERGLAKLEERGAVQLQLYAIVASRRLAQTVVGGLYRGTGAGKPRGFMDATWCDGSLTGTDATDEAGITALLEAARVSAANAVEGMRAGRIDAEPRGGTCPPYCPARAYCPVGGEGGGRTR